MRRGLRIEPAVTDVPRDCISLARRGGGWKGTKDLASEPSTNHRLAAADMIVQNKLFWAQPPFERFGGTF